MEWKIWSYFRPTVLPDCLYQKLKFCSKQLFLLIKHARFQFSLKTAIGDANDIQGAKCMHEIQP